MSAIRQGLPPARLRYSREVTLQPDFTLLQIIPELETGGAEQTTLDVARAVVAAGGQALVASRGGRMVAQLQAEGGVFIPLPAHSKNPLAMAANALVLKRLIQDRTISLVHARSRAPAFSALWAARATKTPFVATYHGVYKAQSRLKRWYNAVMTQGDLVIANSDFTRQHLLAEHRIDPDRVVTIPRGVDLDRFDPARVDPARVAALKGHWGIASEDRRIKIVLAGRLSRIKGHLTVIQAAQTLKAAGRRDFVILFAGDDQGRLGYRQDLQSAIDQADLVDEVRLVGHCDDMPAAFMLCDLAILPTLVPESFGRAAVEPQVMGKPVIASAHGGTLETIVEGETGWLTTPGDPQAWALSLGHALDIGPAGLANMGAVAQARARKLYSNQAMCVATLAVYSRVIAARRAG